MTNANQVELTEAQKEAIEDMVINRVNAMNNDKVLCDAIDAKVHEMEEHLKEYFHQRFHLHSNKA
ncbi:hypothetical protein [Photobacterium leiognathi]|uniref:Uncharacterized protein n=1 Tax=Photobacterium leiognathi TaxID=553611 RepID=A0A2T3MFG1_PHOLE|nr:hypothetical protein [Photobacterium leiognathi]KJF89586.1 hypothetical protein UB42_12580 [Photobacterium leiognathi]KJF97716.1 hypothetical protein UB34_11620 [Photobacterium leiognathi]PSV80990.1 hypothetical protein CTM94_13100 [Photobacterium leiognathi]PSV92704.1 hypothetical protein CTM89_03390 [Photobacterium leiognathi]